MFAKNCQELIRTDQGCKALSTGTCEITLQFVLIRFVLIFQEWHFNRIKTEIKEIYVYSLVSITDRELQLKSNSIMALMTLFILSHYFFLSFYSLYLSLSAFFFLFFSLTYITSIMLLFLFLIIV